MKQDAAVKRKKPGQERSRQTVDTILEAAAQILADDGGESLTTNRLARRAGYSIGTLYQYFENREAIVVALIERQREAMRQQVDMLLEARRGEGWEDMVRAIVRLMHDAFARHRHSDPRLVRALVAFALDRGLPEPTEHFADAIVAAWRGAGEGSGRNLSQAETFVLNRAVIEVLRAATLQSLPLLGTIELEEAIVRLVKGFLQGDGAEADMGAGAEGLSENRAMCGSPCG